MTLAALVAAGSPAEGQTGALPPQVSSPASLEISNTVHCAYDLMSTEDREMALLLLAREVGTRNRSHDGSANLNVIDRLVDEARVKCSVPYAWSSGRSDAAVAYAMNELLSEGIGQALEARGHSAREIDSYFTDHRAALAGTSVIKGTDSEAFRDYLLAKGWARNETATFAIAVFYLETLLARETEVSHFAAAPAVLPPPATSRPVSRQDRAKSARRGKQ